MTEKEPSNEESKKVKFTVLDPKKATGKDIVDFWIAEMEKSEADTKNEP